MLRDRRRRWRSQGGNPIAATLGDVGWQVYLLERADAQGFAVVAESEQQARSMVATRWSQPGSRTNPETVCIELGSPPPGRAFPHVLLRDSALLHNSRR